MRRRRPRPQVHDIVTRTPREAYLDDVDARRRRYLRTALPSVGLILFAFFVPAPVWLRLGALVVAGLLGTSAVGATLPRR